MTRRQFMLAAVVPLIPILPRKTALIWRATAQGLEASGVIGEFTIDFDPDDHFVTIWWRRKGDGILLGVYGCEKDAKKACQIRNEKLSW